MQDKNEVYMAGMAELRHATIRDKFAYVNIIVSGIPVSLNYGGKYYKKNNVEVLEGLLKNGGMHIRTLSPGALIENDRGGWEIKVKGDQVLMTGHELKPYSFVNLVGSVIEWSKDSEGFVWITVKSIYSYKNPKTGNTEEQVRKVRVRLDRPWPEDIVSKRISIFGTVEAGTSPIHVLSKDSMVM